MALPLKRQKTLETAAASLPLAKKIEHFFSAARQAMDSS